MSDRAIVTAIQKLAGTFKQDEVRLIQGVVKSVDEGASTCVVTTVSGDNEIDIPNVLLQSAVCDGLLIIPVVDSNVLVITSTYNSPFVCLYSDIKKVYLQIGDSSLTLFDSTQSDNSIIRINDGSYGGLIKIDDLVSRLNTIENDINTLKTAFSGWTPVPNDGGAALKGATGAWFGQQLTDTQKADIENPLITHGKI